MTTPLRPALQRLAQAEPRSVRRHRRRRAAVGRTLTGRPAAPTVGEPWRPDKVSWVCPRSVTPVEWSILRLRWLPSIRRPCPSGRRSTLAVTSRSTPRVDADVRSTTEALTKGDHARFNTTNQHDAGCGAGGLTGAEGPVACCRTRRRAYTTRCHRIMPSALRLPVAELGDHRAATRRRTERGEPRSRRLTARRPPKRPSFQRRRWAPLGAVPAWLTPGCCCW